MWGLPHEKPQRADPSRCDSRTFSAGPTRCMGKHRSRPLVSRRSRARRALATCVLWLLAFEVLPWLHIATHDHVGKHHHDASGAIVFDDGTDPDDAEHHHHHEHHHADDDRDDRVDEHANEDVDDEDAEVDEHGDIDGQRHHHDHHPQNERDKLLRGALGHGRHSLAHHDVATPAPPPVLIDPLPIDRRPTFVFADTAIAPYSFSPGRAVARGPPLAAFES